MEHKDFIDKYMKETVDITRDIDKQEISKFNLWSKLKCVHVNDSRDPFASNRDRHANIGDGNIPLEDLRYFLNLEKIQSIPLILCTRICANSESSY